MSAPISSRFGSRKDSLEGIVELICKSADHVVSDNMSGSGPDSKQPSCDC